MKNYRRAGRRARNPCSSNSSGNGITAKQTIMTIKKEKRNVHKQNACDAVLTTWRIWHILLLWLKAVQNGHQPWPDAVRCQRRVMLSNTSKSWLRQNHFESQKQTCRVMDCGYCCWHCENCGFKRLRLLRNYHKFPIKYRHIKMLHF